MSETGTGDSLRTGKHPHSVYAEQKHVAEQALKKKHHNIY